MLLPPALHITLHDLVRAVKPLLLDQPVIHTPGRMPLLTWHEPVCLQPLADQRLVRVELRDRRRTGRGLRRAVLQLRVLAHRLPGHPDLLRYATPGHTPRVENPDTLLYGRWHRHVLSFPRYLQMVAPTRESSKTGRANASPRRQHDHMVNFSPATRSTTPRQTGTQTIKQIQRAPLVPGSRMIRATWSRPVPVHPCAGSWACIFLYPYTAMKKPERICMMSRAGAS